MCYCKYLETHIWQPTGLILHDTALSAFHSLKMDWFAGAGERRVEGEEHAGRDDEQVELHHLVRGHQILDKVPEPITPPDLELSGSLLKS